MAAVGQDVGIEDSTPAILGVRRCVSTQTMMIKMAAPPSTTLRAHDDHPVSAATTTMGMLSSLTSLRYLLVTSYKDTQQQSVPLVLWVLVHNITRRRVREIDDGADVVAAPCDPRPWVYIVPHGVRWDLFRVRGGF